LADVASESVDLAYLDPPFCTQKQHRCSDRGRTKEYSFADMWRSLEEYGTFLKERLDLIKNAIKNTGSIFFHCDRTASHVARFLLDECFGPSNFRSEIIWHYRRWSNSKRGLLSSHQTIFFYSKSSQYKFNRLMTDYSPSTNVDQILQRRTRDASNKSVYATNEDGQTISHSDKRGVPLGDVWDIPFLNPKAKERTGYPTQKPILLLERIVSLVTDPGDLVLDPFCGSGTTLVASQMLGRESIGVDVSEDAVRLSRLRLDEPVKTESMLLSRGREAYRNASSFALDVLAGIKCTPVQRNKGIDALLINGDSSAGPVLIRVQRPSEPLEEAVEALVAASRTKNPAAMIVVKTSEKRSLVGFDTLPDGVAVVTPLQLQIEAATEGIQLGMPPLK